MLMLGKSISRKIQQLCLSGIYKQNVSILSRLSDFAQCRRVLYFRPWELYLSFGKCKHRILIQHVETQFINVVTVIFMAYSAHFNIQSNAYEVNFFTYISGLKQARNLLFFLFKA